MKKLLITLLTVVALASLAVGIAWATWTAPGSGSGSAESGNACLLVNVGAVSGLYPGGTVQVPVDFGNCSSDIALDVTSVTPSMDGLGCIFSATYVFNSDGDDHGVSHVAQGAWDTGDTIAVTMRGDAPNECQDQTFAVNVTATGTQH